MHTATVSSKLSVCVVNVKWKRFLIPKTQYSSTEEGQGCTKRQKFLNLRIKLKRIKLHKKHAEFGDKNYILQF